jgi:MoaA/NifB/PqqE/SkfB family radical SAM enzyme
MKNCYETVINGLQDIIALKKERRLSRLRIKAAVTVTKTNIDSLYDLCEFLFDLGVDTVSIEQYSFYSPEVETALEIYNDEYSLGNWIIGDRLEDSAYLEDDEIERLTIQMKRLADSSWNLELDKPYISSLENYYKGVFPGPKSFCRSMENVVAVRGNGDVELCQGFILGNIRKDLSLVDLFNGPEAVRFRKIQEQAISPACFRCSARHFDWSDTELGAIG